MKQSIGYVALVGHGNHPILLRYTGSISIGSQEFNRELSEYEQTKFVNDW